LALFFSLGIATPAVTFLPVIIHYVGLSAELVATFIVALPPLLFFDMLHWPFAVRAIRFR
jgi:hypothetical protein